MVRAFLPQSGNLSIISNTNYSPQDFTSSTGGISPGVDSELHEETPGVFGAMIFDDGVETGFVLVKEV